MKAAFFGALVIAITSSAANADTVDELQSSYASATPAPFSAKNGRTLWQRPGKKGRDCTACHGRDLRRSGQHVTTHKTIEPMAPSANAERLTDKSTIEKWFLRNCKWTWGRECSAREKGDLLQYLREL